MGPGWVGFIFYLFFLGKVSYVAQACLKLIALLLSTGVIGVNHHVRFELAFLHVYVCICMRACMCYFLRRDLFFFKDVFILVI